MSIRQAHVAVCLNENDWHVHFISALNNLPIEQRQAISTFDLVDIDSEDWIDRISKYDVVVWRPNSMGFEGSSYFKEKIYFIEHHLGKLMLPNFATVWHFESKVAQKYLFERYQVKCPRTVVTFDYADAINRISQAEYPIVEKRSTGAGAANVRLLHSYSEARKSIDKSFSRVILKQRVQRDGEVLGKLSIHYLRARRAKKNSAPIHPVAYWQEFIKDNERDLRVTVIGDRYAFGFWRNNRKNDFRASGSGDIDYERPIPHSSIKYCLEVSRILNFDSMAYDIVFDNGASKIIEMSYGYMESAVHRAPGYFELIDDELEFRTGNTWPQKLWADWMLRRISGMQHLSLKST